MTATRTRRLWGLAALAVTWFATAVLLWRTQVPGGLRLPDVSALELLSNAELERIEGYRRGARLLYLASVAAAGVVLAAGAWQARRVAGAARRVGRGEVRGGVVAALLLLAAVWLVQLPFAALAQRRRREHGLSEQQYGAWVRDELLGVAVTGTLVAIAVACAMLLARRLGRRWWVAAAAALVALAGAFTLVQPLVVAPLFNRFEPLPDRRLAARVQRLAARMGVDVERVEVADASRRTTTANAYVAGIGPSRRVVLHDTVVRELPRGELEVLAAHELAHVGRRHIWRGLGWFALLALPGLAFVSRCAGRRGGLARAEAVPVALVAAVVYVAATMPLQMAVSRRYEAEADWLALEATRDPANAVALERRLVRTNLADPTPPRLLTLWLGTHPPAVERVAMARAWKLRARGR